MVWKAKTCRNQTNVGIVRRQRAELVITTNDIDLSGHERGLAEWHSQRYAPHFRTNVGPGETTVDIFTNAEQSEEGEKTSTPVSGVFEFVELKFGAEGAEIRESEGRFTLDGSVVAVVVVEAGLDFIEQRMSREIGVPIVCCPVL